MLEKFHKLAILASLVALCVIVLGAYVRLSHAGLGCPDWPGCYGKLTWPDVASEVVSANEAFPERPVEKDKAWKEMVHRYLAGVLVLLVVALNWIAWRGGEATRSLRKVATFLLVLIIFQAMLGMWTVTLKLKPVIVMAHLLGGMATLSLLTWLSFESREKVAQGASSLRTWVVTGLAVLVLQIALGGWTSANYAALACPDFPTCTGQWWPQTDFKEGFVLWREIGVDYEGGVLDQDARAAIHLAHRIGAIIALIVLLTVAFKARASELTRNAGNILAVLVCVQVTLGILNIVLKLPLFNAVAHNGVAALLLATLVWLLHRSSPRQVT